MIAQIQHSRNETPTEEYLNLAVDKLLNGEFESTIEFYRQERKFYDEYKNGVDKDINMQDKEDNIKLSDNDFKNISATI